MFIGEGFDGGEHFSRVLREAFLRHFEDCAHDGAVIFFSEAG